MFEYNPYDIVRKTHGMLRGDSYWIKFKDEELTYRTAREDWKSYYPEVKPPVPELSAAAPLEDVSDIMRQHETNFSDIADNVAHGVKSDGFDVKEYGQPETRAYNEEKEDLVFSPYNLAALGLSDLEKKPMPEPGNELTDD